MGNCSFCFKVTTGTPRPPTEAGKFADIGLRQNDSDRNSDKGMSIPRTPSKFLVRANYKFDALGEDDLSFKKNDLLEIDDVKLLDSEDWISAVHHKNRRSGLIPSNYVVIADSSPQSQEWWFPLDKYEAAKVLLQPGYSFGTFLVRESGDKLSYVLSVRQMDKTTGDPCVKHYRVHALDDDRGFYVNPRLTFSSFFDLINFYKETKKLGCKLKDSYKSAPPVIPFRQLEVRRDQVRLETRLGGGCFANVWKGIYNKSLNVAVKQLKTSNSGMTSEAFLEEAKIMHQLRHRKLVQLMGVVSSEEPFYIITELMENGALLNYLRSEDGKSLRFITLVDMNAQVAEGMSFLEERELIHRDLRAANVLVGHNNEVKVADFGLARMLEEGIYESGQESKFPLKWTALEAIDDHVFTVKSDVWSFGVLMYEIITYGGIPYPGMTNTEAVEQLRRGYRMEIPSRLSSGVPPSYQDMMLKCWNKNAEERPTFASLYDFFTDYFIHTEPKYKDPRDIGLD